MDFVHVWVQKVEEEQSHVDVAKEEKFYQDKQRPLQNRQWFFILHNCPYFKMISCLGDINEKGISNQKEWRISIYFSEREIFCE